MTMQIAYERIKAALDRAVENGYPEMKRWDAEQIYMDLTTYDQEFEEFTYLELEAHIERWLEEQR